MRMVKDQTGRFSQRPHYAPAELDRECECLVRDFLTARYGKAEFPITTDDLTTLVERDIDDIDQFADLSQYGTGVEGVTIFVPGGKPIVKISQQLSEDDRRENRLRTTLTHEFGHVRYHAYLFDPVFRSLDLFQGPGSGASTDAQDRVQVCKRDTMVDSSTTDWMEWQAGHVCGAILMPASHVRELIRAKFPERIEVGPIAEDDPATTAMVEEIQRIFQVSRDAARVRLLRLEIVKPRSAMPLV